MKTADIQQLNDTHVINTYGQRQIALRRGEGCLLWDVEGKQYLDMFAGIAVCNLGHSHPGVAKALCEQAQQLIHVSNLYYIESQATLAKALAEHSFAPRWFFCNGGSDANEGAIKLARRYWAQKGTPKPGIIAMEQSFHGRTLGSLSATGQPKYHEGFGPLLPGFTHVPFDDLAAIEAAITPETGAVMLEPIQGEGGVRVPDEDYLEGVRALCDKHGLLMILDEVQTGVGRTGTFLAHQGMGCTPDIVTMAKALANGVPIGALGCTEEVASGFAPGSHATTFGGNPLSTTAALVVLDEILAPGFLHSVLEKGTHLMLKLTPLMIEHRMIKSVRIRGLMIGIEFAEPVAPLIAKLIEKGIICGPAGPKVLRFVPPLIITKEQLDQAADTLQACLKELGW